MGADESALDGDLAAARDLALRYRCEFVNLYGFRLQSAVLEKVPVHLMFRYNFVPLAELQDGRIAIAVADPSQLLMFDEISLLLGKAIVVRVATLAQIYAILSEAHGGPSQITNPTPGAPPSPSGPDALVGVPVRPRPHAGSGAAKAVPEPEQ